VHDVLLALLAIYIAGEAYAVGESDRIWSAGSCQIVAVFSEILTLAMQVSVDMKIKLLIIGDYDR
jgi:hypothetical protein